jgi:hypothetical protein
VERNFLELEAVQETVVEKAQATLLELDDLQLVLVGGGIGDTAI